MIWWIWVSMWYILALPIMGTIFYYLNGKNIYTLECDETIAVVLLWIISPIVIPGILIVWVCKDIFMMGFKFPRLIEDMKKERENNKKKDSGWKRTFGG